jgi:hypothetical protein
MRTTAPTKTASRLLLENQTKISHAGHAAPLGQTPRAYRHRGLSWTRSRASSQPPRRHPKALRPTGTLWLDKPSTLHRQGGGLRRAGRHQSSGHPLRRPHDAGYSENSGDTGGTLTVKEETHVAKIAPLGNYMATSFLTAAERPPRHTGHASAADREAAAVDAPGPIAVMRSDRWEATTSGERPRRPPCAYLEARPSAYDRGNRNRSAGDRLAGYSDAASTDRKRQEDAVALFVSDQCVGLGK